MSIKVEMGVNKDGKKELVVTERIQLPDYEDTNNQIVSYLSNKDKLKREITNKYCTHHYNSKTSAVYYNGDIGKFKCKICGAEFVRIINIEPPSCIGDDINNPHVKDICHTLLAYGENLNIFEQAYLLNILESGKCDTEELFKLYTSTRKTFSYEPNNIPNGYQFIGYDNSLSYPINLPPIPKYDNKVDDKKDSNLLKNKNISDFVSDHEKTYLDEIAKQQKEDKEDSSGLFDKENND